MFWKWNDAEPVSLFFSTVDGYGFQRSETFDQKGYDDFMSQYLGVMTRRAMRWNNVFGNSDKITRSRLGMLCCSSYIELIISFILFHSMCSQKFRPGNHPKVCGSLPHLNLISHIHLIKIPTNLVNLWNPKLFNRAVLNMWY